VEQAAVADATPVMVSAAAVVGAQMLLQRAVGPIFFSVNGAKKVWFDPWREYIISIVTLHK
jgi:hypothetical protein